MQSWQQNLIIIWTVYSALAFIKGVVESKDGKNTHGSAGVFVLTGAFVWADAVIFGAFWIITSLLSLYLSDWILFFLLISVFWTVRAWGEATFFFNQQFSQKTKVKPEKMRLTYKFFQNDSVWFVRQIQWQSVMVIGIIATIYLAKVWF